ncbi:Uncharacterized protein SCF082_LOCUS20622 [Durusdinium trenchii]|uniref:Uncharacterized protein n=1 Tax=Durusdinium trenchii TaxID=1381693 RepID=A0ABP0L689_9DINO
MDPVGDRLNTGEVSAVRHRKGVAAELSGSSAGSSAELKAWNTDVWFGGGGRSEYPGDSAKRLVSLAAPSSRAPDRHEVQIVMEETWDRQKSDEREARHANLASADQSEFNRQLSPSQSLPHVPHIPREEKRQDTEVVSLQHLKSAKTRAQVRGSLGRLAEIMRWLAGNGMGKDIRGHEIDQCVREQAKALGRGVGYEKSSGQSAFLPAQDAASRIEAEAVRLSKCEASSEVIERWLALLRTNQRRYTDGDRHGDGDRREAPPRPLSFKQVFLRSRALELALDTSARSAELRHALRSYALTTPTRWPESCPPPMAFARAFVALLWATVGSTEIWLQLLGTLLSSEQTPHAGHEAEEPCHTWLVQLIAARRQNWQASDVVDRETEILTLEQKATEALALTEPHGQGFASKLQQLSLLSSAVVAMENVVDRRASLAEEVQRAIVAEKEQRQLYQSTVSSVATSAKALADSLAANGQDLNANGLTERRAQLCSKSEGLKARLTDLSPELERLASEIETAEEVQRELMQQLKQNKEHLESLRKQRDEGRKEEEHLRHSLQRTEQRLASQLASEEVAKRRSEASQALAFAVADVAEQLKEEKEEKEKDMAEAPKLGLTLQRNQQQRNQLLTVLTKGEVERARKAAEVAKEALPLAQAFAAKQGGSPKEEAESPRKGAEDAENSEQDSREQAHLQELRQSIKELKSLSSEQILSRLEDAALADDAGCEQSLGPLVAEIRDSLESCREALITLEALGLPEEMEKDSWEVVEERGHHESFLFGLEESPQEREAFGWDTSGLKNLFNGLAARARSGGAERLPSTGAEDPFLLEGLVLEDPQKREPLETLETVLDAEPRKEMETAEPKVAAASLGDSSDFVDAGDAGDAELVQGPQEELKPTGEAPSDKDEGFCDPELL